MKRHNEGYALPFVLVVLVVMCIIAVGIMDFSLRNLQSQKATIQRMEAKYEAAGKIEEIVAAIENGEKVYSFPRTSQLDFAIIPISDTEKYVRIVSCSQNDDEQTLWVIAELKVPVSQWAPDEVDGALTSEAAKCIIDGFFMSVLVNNAAANTNLGIQKQEKEFSGFLFFLFIIWLIFDWRFDDTAIMIRGVKVFSTSHTLNPAVHRRRISSLCIFQ